MMNWIKTKWHEFWYKCYHLPKSVKGVSVKDNKLVFKDEKYHTYHFEKAWHHALKYQELDPEGMKVFAEKCVKNMSKMV